MAQLYRCYSSDGGLLYVGMSLNALKRLREHKATSAWFESLATLTVDHFRTRTEALAAEKQAITMDKPLYNRQHRPRLRVDYRMPKKWSPADSSTRSEQTRAGLARARAAGRIGGRRTVYTDAVIREAIGLHQAGRTWAAAAAAVGISLDRLYARLRTLPRKPAEPPPEGWIWSYTVRFGWVAVPPGEGGKP